MLCCTCYAGSMVAESLWYVACQVCVCMHHLCFGCQEFSFPVGQKGFFLIETCLCVDQIPLNDIHLAVEAFDGGIPPAKCTLRMQCSLLFQECDLSACTFLCTCVHRFNVGGFAEDGLINELNSAARYIPAAAHSVTSCLTAP